MVFLLLLQVVFLGCNTDSGTDNPGRAANRRLWGLPVRLDNLTSSADSTAFSFAGTGIETFRLWNNCYTFFGKDSINGFFLNGAHFDSIASVSADTLVLSYAGSEETVRYLELPNRCVDTIMIATLKLEAGGFEDNVYTDADSIRLRFSFSIRPDKKAHQFILSFYGQMDGSNSTSFYSSHFITGLSGVFDTTISVADIPHEWKIRESKYLRYAIGYFRTDNNYPTVGAGEKRRVVSIFE